MRTQESAVPLIEYPTSAANLKVEEDEFQDAGQAIGVSASWRKLLAQAAMVAPHVRVAALEGEHGSGKHTLARYMFSRSPLAGSVFQRRDAREWLATDADPMGITGCLYLDRVDLLTPPGQNVLLAVLRGFEERTASRAVLLVSSHKPLRQMAAEGHFLPDLAYRLTMIRFAVPPLRQRREDIGPLAQALLDRVCARYKQRRPVVFGPGALARLLQHDWPGNVRELAGVLEAALLEAVNGVIQPSDLMLTSSPEPDPEPPLHARRDALSLEAVIRQHVQNVLDLNHGNKLRTARQLRISRSTLYRILANEGLLTR